MFDLDQVKYLIQNSKSTLFILCGFPYSGKSYVVSHLVEQTRVVVVNIDDIFKARGFDWDDNKLPSPDEWKGIFDESYEKIKIVLKEGKSVLYDSTNQTLASRDKLREVAVSVGVDTCVFYIKTPIETVWQRWEENRNNLKRSVVSRELVQATIDMFEEPTEGENVIIVNNS